VAEEEKKEKKITLEQFRAWLEGVEEMQEDAWAPDVRQWAKIRRRIDNIEGTTNVAQPQQVLNAPQYHQPVAQVSAFDPIVPPDRPAPVVDMSQNAPIANDPSGKRAVKTPDIDTTAGDYNSAFE